ncbi:DUF4382 domain-containing protein [Halomicrococcus gelatinilyticus]|uniref:DUF4382 domain-containing protein n=1 Tax=Halomicrococcus gelatinilyticus TaxID=1702103 RepID=UPI002E0EE529
MARRHFRAVLVASIVLLAGCVGGLSGSTGSPTTDGEQTDTTQPAGASDAGTVAFYVSDEKNAIGDFQHLNVTVTRVGFERTSADGSASADANASANATAAAENGTSTADNGTSADDDTAADGGGWVEREVDDRTVDLTELQGPNSTLVDEYAIESGTYGKVFVHVGEVNATLQNGEQVRVKLPSKKLHINEEFTIENGSQVDFVFDIAVHKAGKSGKYILKPVISESGTDVPIEPIGDQERRDGLNAQFVGNVSQTGNVTVEVTRDGEPVRNATVRIGGDVVGTTDADGRVTAQLPGGAKAKVTVEKGDDEAELDMEFGHEDEQDEEKDDGDAGGQAAAGLNAKLVGKVVPGESATIRVTEDASVVANATVVVNGEIVGTTGSNGELTFEAPTSGSLAVTVEAGDAEVELEHDFASDASS